MDIIFLPYPNFPLSAHVLSPFHLSRNRALIMMLLRTLAGSGWARRWTTEQSMWQGHEASLLELCRATVTEWQRRGYEDNFPSPDTPEDMKHWGLPDDWLARRVVHPPWLGWERFHSSHRSMLLNKDEEWYRQFCWVEDPRHELIWPGGMPEPGEGLTDGKSALLVVKVTKKNVLAVDQKTGKRRKIAQEDIIKRRWRRASNVFSPPV